MTLEERWKAKVIFAGSNRCWLWKGKRSKGRYGGYGCMRGGFAHRIAYELFIGPIPKGMRVCHSCDNPPCVNPRHLWLGTDADNAADKIAKGRSNHKPLFRDTGNGMAKLTKKQVASLLKDYMKEANTHTQRDLAARYGVSYRTVQELRKKAGLPARRTGRKPVCSKGGTDEIPNS